jgi:glyoxylase-like metal-dependent hydrolase (beta-lactamase superfamily II)
MLMAATLLTARAAGCTSTTAARLGNGHTEGDAFLWLPDDGVLFTADLVVIQLRPWMGNGNLESWHKILNRLQTFEARTLVPSHGPVGTLDAIPAVQQYLSETVQLVPDSNGFFGHCRYPPMEAETKRLCSQFS